MWIIHYRYRKINIWKLYSCDNQCSFTKKKTTYVYDARADGGEKHGDGGDDGGSTNVYGDDVCYYDERGLPPHMEVVDAWRKALHKDAWEELHTVCNK